jgi:hypothetical protein
VDSRFTPVFGELGKRVLNIGSSDHRVEGLLVAHRRYVSPRVARASDQGMIQPPTLADEHRWTALPEHANWNDGCGRSFGFNPRSTHISEHPRTQVMVVGPGGASTTNSKAGSGL